MARNTNVDSKSPEASTNMYCLQLQHDNVHNKAKTCGQRDMWTNRKCWDNGNLDKPKCGQKIVHIFVLIVHIFWFRCPHFRFEFVDNSFGECLERFAVHIFVFKCGQQTVRKRKCGQKSCCPHFFVHIFCFGCFHLPVRRDSRSPTESQSSETAVEMSGCAAALLAGRRAGWLAGWLAEWSGWLALPADGLMALPAWQSMALTKQEPFERRYSRTRRTFM